MSRRVLLPIEPSKAKRLYDEVNAKYIQEDVLEFLVKVIGVTDPVIDKYKSRLLMNRGCGYGIPPTEYDRIKEDDVWACQIVYTDYGGEGLGLKQKSIIVIDKNWKVREDWHETLSKTKFSK